MATRINFWPCDLDLLNEVAGSGDQRVLQQIVELSNEQIDPEMEECSRCSELMAQSIVKFGFSDRGDFEERWCHQNAAFFLAQQVAEKHNYPIAGSHLEKEFRYFDFLDSIPMEVFHSVKQVESAFCNGTPWFGRSCGKENMYGTIRRSDIKILADRLSEVSTSIPDVGLNEVIELFQYFAQKNIDVWFCV